MPTEKSTTESTTASVCKYCNGVADVLPNFCRHKSFCTPCMSLHNVWACPECLYPIHNYTSDKYGYEETIDKYIAPSDVAKTDLFINIILRSIRSARSLSVDVIETLISETQQLYIIFTKDAPKCCMLSVPQCELILVECLKRFDGSPKIYMLQNFFVALCKFPWWISIQHGGSGICYHGNMGTTPCVVDAGHLITRNDYQLRNSETFFK